MHAFSPGHMHCSPVSLVYMESLQSSCFFLYNLPLPMRFGLSAAGSAQHLLAQLGSMSLNYFSGHCIGGSSTSERVSRWGNKGKCQSDPSWSYEADQNAQPQLWEQGLYCPFWYQEVTLRMQTFLPGAITELGLGRGSQVNKDAKILSWQRWADFFFIKYSPGCCTVFIWFQFQKCWFWQSLMPA